jgi:hypothetical protein
VGTLVIATVAFLAVSAVLLWRRRWPTYLAVYSAAVVGLCLMSRSDGLRPRDLLVAFPLIAATAASVNDWWFTRLRNASAALLTLLLIVHNLGQWTQP